ncbi:5'-methylthioadenosine/S-adenosylhomocysteine nucleosidase [Mechercharimyces sp. CAU 1602]|uniref:5'-methylthioadenosine/S-adenosylhomocysteine nucleosidase n=1 Tax=Mechercharimyces sp. CAU 1602 TaxID=2973933 RepID=UPI0021623181|nr:5'-methylthioadenosine/S-adenosylhomocysteine nucleosidase [Mechercharimyces sp. CAU 1602]MCS1350096.1 5'-methylthioadenosine/S-adenosylhomocysteine nucleosidase [Mechercharimyces sp. CAU 1602]
MIIGIQAAGLEDLNLIVEEMSVKREVRISSQIQCVKGLIQGFEVIACSSGVGKVNTALGIQSLIHSFSSNIVLSSGGGGALNPNLNSGDVVIATGSQFHDVNYTEIDVPLSQYPSLRVSVYKTNKKLVKLAVQGAQTVPSLRIATGKILTGDQFITRRKLKERLRLVFGGQLVETSSASVGLTTLLSSTPYLSVRGVTDTADQNEPASREVVREARNHSQMVILELLSAIKKKYGL